MITTDITLFLQIVNMVVLMFLLNGVLYKPIRRILAERAARLQGMQEDIAKFEKNARIRQEEVDAKMAQASGKAKAALDSARAEAQQAGATRLAAIKAEADAEKESQLGALKSEIEEARSALQANLQGFASDMAGKILGRSI
ncbi:MAG: ATP synthase F0 subunit B [Desulforhopalus sp.]|jgi:F-type H+-transporting ATPase subunit b|nr:ATP synthase F0 subunit B [Desulforhopalus sp.]